MSFWNCINTDEYKEYYNVYRYKSVYKNLNELIELFKEKLLI